MFSNRFFLYNKKFLKKVVDIYILNSYVCVVIGLLLSLLMQALLDIVAVFEIFVTFETAQIYAGLWNFLHCSKGVDWHVFLKWMKMLKT